MLILVTLVISISMGFSEEFRLSDHPFHEKFENPTHCSIYSEVMPNGYCQEHLNNTRVSMHPQKIRETEKDFLFFLKMFEFYQDISGEELLDKLRFFANIYLDECQLNETAIQNYLATIQLVSTKNMIKCLNTSTWLICHMFIPRCELNESSNTFQYKPMCRESCFSYIESDICRDTYNFVVSLFTLSGVCPERFENIEQFNCSYYPSVEGDSRLCFNKNLIKLSEEEFIELSSDRNRLPYVILVISISVGVFVIAVSVIVFLFIKRYQKIEGEKKKEGLSNLPPYNATLLTEVPTNVSEIPEESLTTTNEDCYYITKHGI